MTSTQTPVAEGLFSWPADPPRLLASECRQCGVVTFPRQSGCPRCNSQEMGDRELPERGSLWTFTTQEFVPKSPPYLIEENPKTFRPFAVGYVEFPGVVKVEGRIDADDLESLRIGMEMEVVVVPLTTDSEGREVMTYAFRPTGS